MQPLVGLANKLAALDITLAPDDYANQLAENLAHDEARHRLRLLHEDGFSSAFYDSDLLTIRFHNQEEFTRLCRKLEDSPENVTRRFLFVHPVLWLPYIRKMKDDAASGVFNLCIRAEEEKRRLHNVPVQMGPCSILNAGAIPVPSGGECILLHSGITRAGDLARLLYADVSKETMLAFSALSHHVTVGGASAKDVAKAVELANAERSPSGIDTRGTIASMFILMHEYAHVMLGHLELLRGVVFTTLSGKQKRGLLEAMRHYEYEADEWAYARMLDADWHLCSFERDPNGKMTCALGLTFVFEILRIAELLQPNSNHDMQTHPAAYDRKGRLLQFCSKHIQLPLEFSEQVSLMTKIIPMYIFK
jgi:hypothetical protein